MEPREIKTNKFPRRPWTDHDRERLRSLMDNGHDSIYCALKLKRPRQDVIEEIDRLGLNVGYEPDPMEKPRTMRHCLSCGKEFLSRVGNVCPKCKDRVEFKSSAVDHYMGREQ